MSCKKVCATGTLAIGACGPVLRLDGGGEWEVGDSRACARHMGQRVEVIGRRTGFNGLICDEVWPEGGSRPRRLKLNAEFWLVASFVTYGLVASLKALFD